MPSRQRENEHHGRRRPGVPSNLNIERCPQRLVRTCSGKKRAHWCRTADQQNQKNTRRWHAFVTAGQRDPWAQSLCGFIKCFAESVTNAQLYPRDRRAPSCQSQQWFITSKTCPSEFGRKRACCHGGHDDDDGLPAFFFSREICRPQDVRGNTFCYGRHRQKCAARVLGPNEKNCSSLTSQAGTSLNPMFRRLTVSCAETQRWEQSSPLPLSPEGFAQASKRVYPWHRRSFAVDRKYASRAPWAKNN